MFTHPKKIFWSVIAENTEHTTEKTENPKHAAVPLFANRCQSHGSKYEKRKYSIS